MLKILMSFLKTKPKPQTKNNVFVHNIESCYASSFVHNNIKFSLDNLQKSNIIKHDTIEKTWTSLYPLYATWRQCLGSTKLLELLFIANGLFKTLEFT